ncbi:MAG: hypothetical protein M1817_005598 [Caeruleum heppii]|nr:MAG: hypothetical protein M1817_005598 [Caeruleum heppii]
MPRQEDLLRSLPQDAYPVTRQGVTVPPFCTTSCKTNPVVAVGDETGRIRLLDTANKANQGISRSFYVINAHNNALLDLDFSSDDRLIATASGDQTSHVIDVRAGRVISRLDGHTSSVKRVQFQPGSGSDSIIVTSSRDGRVKLWDIRQKGKTVRQLQVAIAPDDALQMPKVDRASYALPITTISQAHPSTAPPTWPGMSKRQQAASRSQSVTPPSVTALSFLPPGREHLLLTASDSNACVRLWDTRWVSDGHVSTTQQPEAHDSYRPFGINSLALSGDGERVYSLCRDSTVYAYSTNHLILGHAPELSGSKSKVGKGDKTGLGPMYGFRHPKLHTGSFYVKMSLRKAKDDQTEMLGVGSTDGCPILFPTDEAIFKDGLSDAMGGLQLDDGPGNDVPSNSLRRTRSQTNNARSKPPGKPPCRPLDSIPIHQHGRALVEGHDREVTAPSWTSQGNLVSAGDDCLVRCWREGRNKSREVRREKATGCGWAQGVEGDAEDSEDD